MKKLFILLFFIIAIGLNSCTPVKESTIDIDVVKIDYLVYLINNNPQKQQLFLYDPSSKSNTQILSNWDIKDFCISKNYSLAFSSIKDGFSKIYVLAYPFTDNTPIEITLDISVEYTPLSWSPDGHFLLLDSVQENNKRISVWDGESIVNIYEYHEQVGEIAWSSKGHLAFTDFYTFTSPNGGDSSEIFLWNGHTTVSISQNPSGEDRFPAWSNDGRLAFLSERNREYDIFVWDGKSKKDDLPDLGTYINIAPELTLYHSEPIWTNTDTITFGASSKSGKLNQIYEWDGQSAKNISKNPQFHNGGQTWSDEGNWAFITYFSSSQKLYVRNNNNQTILETEGQYPPAWSKKGLLVFCVPQNTHWSLTIWDGYRIKEITRGEFIKAMWNNGNYVFCSFG